MYLALLLELAGLHEERGELEAAIESLERAVAAEPTREEAHAALMRLHAISGRQRQALRQYERLSGALSGELDLEPSVEVRELREEISAGAFPTRRPVSPPESAPGADTDRHNLPVYPSSFVGPEREMVEVKRALAMTRLLTLTGAGGSGKTRLALAVARSWRGCIRTGCGSSSSRRSRRGRSCPRQWPKPSV